MYELLHKRMKMESCTIKWGVTGTTRFKSSTYVTTSLSLSLSHQFRINHNIQYVYIVILYRNVEKLVKRLAKSDFETVLSFAVLCLLTFLESTSRLAHICSHFWMSIKIDGKFTVYV